MRSHISWFERFVQTRHVLRHFVFVGQFVCSTCALLITSTVTIKTCFHVMAQCFYFCSRDHGMCIMLCLLVYFNSHNHAIVVLVLFLCLCSLSDNTYMCVHCKNINACCGVRVVVYRNCFKTHKPCLCVFVFAYVFYSIG